MRARITEAGRECSICHEFKPWAEYAKGGPRSVRGHTSECKACHRERFNATGCCTDCGKSVSKGAARCKPCNGARLRSTGRPDGEGYLRYKVRGKTVRAHRAVMEQMLGRPLLPDENAHHKNGDRSDNRPANLELWSTSQPPGQRVEDKIQWCKEFLARYETPPHVKEK